MTQEQHMRKMLDGFIADPPDSPYQDGFLAALIVVANEVMGVAWDDALLLAAGHTADTAAPEVTATLAKVRPALTVIDGGKSSVD